MAPPKKPIGKRPVVMAEKPVVEVNPVVMTDDPVVEKPEAKVDKPEVEKKPKEPRKPVTLETYIIKMDNLIETLDDEIDRRSREKEKGIRSIRAIRKEVRELRSQLPKIATHKRKVNRTAQSGFSVKKPISDELCRFLKKPIGSKFTGHEITYALCMYVHVKEDEERTSMLYWLYLNPDKKRDLQNKDKRVIIDPDSALSKLLGYDEYVASVKAGEITINRKDKDTGQRSEVVVTDPSLYYYVMPKLIQKHFI